MSDPEGFLSRWSRRKREVSQETEAANIPTAADPAEDDRTPGRVSSGRAPTAIESVPDPTGLPSIESITAKTDVRAFLATDVPADLARAALRRAWSSDPAIRDFVGLSENSWDFNAPDGIPGFGPIDPADVGRLVAQAAGKPEVTPPAAPGPGNASPPAAPTQKDKPQPGESDRTASEGDPSAASEQGLRAQEYEVTAANGSTQRTRPDVAVQNPPEQDEDRVTLPRRGHGGALPE
jgi:uncharacterized protein DUF3306